MKKIYYVAKSLRTLMAMNHVELRHINLLNKYNDECEVQEIRNLALLGADVIMDGMVAQLNTVLKPIAYPEAKYNPAKLDILASTDEGIVYTWEDWMLHKTSKPVILTYELEDFLRKESVYTRFMKNVKNLKGKFPVDISYVISGFMWDKSPEGTEYWRRLHYKHQEYLEIINQPKELKNET